MASRWKSYYRRKWRRYYRKKYSSQSKRSYGQMRAAKQQADTASFVMNIPTQISCKSIQANMDNKVYEFGTFALNIFDLLRKSEFYQSYANMYDEFKIDNIKVKLIPTKYNVTVGDTNNSGYQSFTVYTAWDRTGLNAKQLLLKTNSGIYDNKQISPNTTGQNMEYVGKPGDMDGVYCIVGSDITTYSSAESRQISVGQNSSITRWLKPKTMAEKSQWISTTSLKPWYGNYDNVNCSFKMIPIFDNDAVGRLALMQDLGNKALISTLSSISPCISNNPCFIEEDPTIIFKPTLLVGLYPSDTLGTENPRTVHFNIEAEVSTTFRGLRRSRVVSTEVGDNDNTVIINKSFVLQNNGNMNVNGLNIRENIEVRDANIQTDVPIGTVDNTAPQIINNNNNNRNDLKNLKSMWRPSDWVVWIKRKLSSSDNELYNVVDTSCGVPKYDSEYVIFTRDGQLSDTDYSTVVEAINEGLFEIKNVQMLDGSRDFSYYWITEDSFRLRKTRTLTSGLMTALLVKVGAIVVSKVKECVTIQAGARFTIEDTGYWWYKHGDKSLYLNNDYIKEDHDNEELTINLHQGDCYFYFGTDVDLSSIGFGDFKFSAMIDNNYNVCFNTPFGEWSLSTKSLIQNIGVKLLDWGKCQFTLISDKIWKVFSLFTGSRNTNLELNKSPSSLNYPGLKIYNL